MTLLMLAIFMVMVGDRQPLSGRRAASCRSWSAFPRSRSACCNSCSILRDWRDTEAARATVALKMAEEQVARMPAAACQFDMPSENACSPRARSTPEVVRKEMIVWGYFLGLIGGILLFGFYITVPIFLVAFLRF